MLVRRFRAREAAFRVLAAAGDRARPVLGAALAARPSAETRKSLASLPEKVNYPYSPERLRNSRLVEMLEHVGGKKAAQLPEAISKGALGPTAAHEAKASIRRPSGG